MIKSLYFLFLILTFTCLIAQGAPSIEGTWKYVDEKNNILYMVFLGISRYNNLQLTAKPPNKDVIGERATIYHADGTITNTQTHGRPIPLDLHSESGECGRFYVLRYHSQDASKPHEHPKDKTSKRGKKSRKKHGKTTSWLSNLTKDNSGVWFRPEDSEYEGKILWECADHDLPEGFKLPEAGADMNTTLQLSVPDREMIPITKITDLSHNTLSYITSDIHKLEFDAHNTIRANKSTPISKEEINKFPESRADSFKVKQLIFASDEKKADFNQPQGKSVTHSQSFSATALTDVVKALTDTLEDLTKDSPREGQLSNIPPHKTLSTQFNNTPGAP